MRLARFERPLRHSLVFSLVARAGADAAEDEEVDVTTVDPIVAFCSRL